MYITVIGCQAIADGYVAGMNDTPTTEPATRGPTEHAVRDQIIEAANECFAHYGFQKTTVSDLAKAIGFSKAYIYRFFESKQAIGEAICRSRLDTIVARAQETMRDGDSANDRFRRMFKTTTELSVDLFFHDRKIYEVASLAASENWESARTYTAMMMAMIEEVVKDGRATGEFERKTPLDEACRAIFYAMSPFVNPLHLERNLALVPEGQNEVASLILRSLTP